MFSDNDNILPQFHSRCLTNIESLVFDENTIRSHLRSLPSKYSCGPDSIPTIFLKNLHNVLSVPLCIIFQQSLDNGLLPKMWKHANIVSVYKGSGSRYSVENYRPISLTSTIC